MTGLFDREATEHEHLSEAKPRLALDTHLGKATSIRPDRGCGWFSPIISALQKKGEPLLAPLFCLG